jgi:hypothetical protein
MRFTSLVVLATSLSSVAHAISQTGPAAAVASPDGQIVPFSSTLPACGSLCGHLFDVQGACTPPHLTSIDKNCFCTDPRLTPLLQGGSAFETACGTQSCQDSADQQKIESWYAGYCNKQLAQPSTTASAPTSTPTNSGNGSNTPQNKSWYVSPRSSLPSSTCANLQRTGLRVITDGSSSPLSSQLRL